jgi:hypothetical protein
VLIPYQQSYPQLLWKTDFLAGMSEMTMKAALNDEMNMPGNKSVRMGA